MYNVYSFNATVVNNQDKRERQNLKIVADAASLHKAWDKAERKADDMFPDHTIELSVGNRQPFNLRS